MAYVLLLVAVEAIFTLLLAFRLIKAAVARCMARKDSYRTFNMRIGSDWEDLKKCVLYGLPKLRLDAVYLVNVGTFVAISFQEGLALEMKDILLMLVVGLVLVIATHIALSSSLMIGGEAMTEALLECACSKVKRKKDVRRIDVLEAALYRVKMMDVIASFVGGRNHTRRRYIARERINLDTWLSKASTDWA